MYLQLSLKYAAGTALLLTICSFSQVTTEDRFTCYPNNTLTIKNPNSTVFLSAIASYSDGSLVHVCTVSGTDEVAITDCNLNYTVTIVFSNRPNVTDLIQGGTKVQAFSVNCEDITCHVVHDLSGTLGVTLPVTPEGTVTPTYTLAAGFFNDNSTTTGSPAYTAIVGETVFFIITGPVEYYLKPLECIVYNNPSKSSATSSKTTIIDGCSEDNRLMGNFSRVELPLEFEYVASFFVFKFLGSREVFLECSVRVCPEPGPCTIISCDSSNKRRSIKETYQGLVGKDSRIATIGRRLRIVDKPIAASSPLQCSPNLIGSLAVTVILGTYSQKMFIRKP